MTVYKTVMTALRKTVEAEDATRAFWLSSPSNEEFGENSDDPNRGDVHYWAVWHKTQPFSNYLTVRPRFASEFGFQSFPEPRHDPRGDAAGGVESFEPRDGASPAIAEGNMLITNTMAREMRIPKDFDAFCWVSQINQAMAIRTAVEHWRRLRPWCMGTIYWQLNDLWPVASWSSHRLPRPLESIAPFQQALLRAAAGEHRPRSRIDLRYGPPRIYPNPRILPDTWSCSPGTDAWSHGDR